MILVERDAAFGAEEIDRRGGHALGELGDWDVLEGIPNDTAAAILLVENRWAIALREAIVGEGGMPLGEAWITIPDLIARRCPGPRGSSECELSFVDPPRAADLEGVRGR